MNSAKLLRILSYILPVAIFSSIWVPELAHYHVTVPFLSEEIIRTSRSVPSNEVLDEIGEYRVLNPWPGTLQKDQVIREANNVLRGEFRLEGSDVVRFNWPFDPEDFTKAPTQWTFKFAGFAVPDRLIKAYFVTREDVYLDRALEFVLAFREYEDSVWLPRGLLWNDHTVAERVFVLVDIWRAYRAHPRFEEATGRKIVELIERYAELLAKPSHFTVATNHGVMQNLALLHVSLALPALPNAKHYLVLGLDRIQAQMLFYLSPEGPVLEHGSGYHRFGLSLTGMLIRYMALNGIPVPRELEVKYQRAMSFYALLRRPDGSLPMIGDTDYDDDPLGPPVVADAPLSLNGKVVWKNDWKPDRAFAVYPLSGYALWWSGLDVWPDPIGLSQVAVSWSHFPGHGHMRPSELSVLFWARGQTWWTNSGYWTSDYAGWQAANSWEGSNAPHLLGESASSQRSSVLNGFASGQGAAAIDIQRDGPGSLHVRRQIIEAAPNLWLVLTQAIGNGQTAVTSAWTAAPYAMLASSPYTNAFRLSKSKTQASLDVSFSGSEDVSVEHKTGSESPFAGWVFRDGEPRAALSLLVEQRKDKGWSAVIWSLSDPGKPFAFTNPPIVTWRDAENWTVRVQRVASETAIARQDGIITIGETRLLLESPESTIRELGTLRAALDRAKQEYPKYRDYLPYKFKISYILLLFLAIQIACSTLFMWKLRPYAHLAYAAAVCTWGAIGIWLHAVYFT